jgi:hypothetical protein
MPATFDELFPGESEPFAPIQPGRSQLDGMRRAGIQASVPGMGDSGFDDAFGDLLTAEPASTAADGQTEWKDYGHRRCRRPRQQRTGSRRVRRPAGSRRR